MPFSASRRPPSGPGRKNYRRDAPLLLPNVSLSANTTYNDNTIQYRGAFILPPAERRCPCPSGGGPNITAMAMA
ncbi:MAG: hypothetical protein WDM70_05575 [Nitrosomonadales bacterium]